MLVESVDEVALWSWQCTHVQEDDGWLCELPTPNKHIRALLMCVSVKCSKFQHP